MPLVTKLTLECAKRLLPEAKFATSLSAEASRQGGHAVYLTFDDGPHEEHTPRLLDELGACDAKATFFVIGEYASRLPELVSRIYSEGHAVGTHSWSHMSSTQWGFNEWMDDVRRARGAVEDILGEACTLFRPPYGELTPRTTLGLLREGFRIIHWSHDTKDFQCEVKSEIIDWFHANPPLPGSVVLLHEKSLTCAALSEALTPWREVAQMCGISSSA